jgi:excisionase family DNA binding protein
VSLHSYNYLTPQEAAEYLRSSPSTLAKLRVYGGGPHFCRIGKAIRYRRSDLDAFMSARRVRSTSEPMIVEPETKNASVVVEERPTGPERHLTDDRAIKAETRNGSRDERKEVKGADTRR